MLLALGIPADSMRVLVVKDLVRNIGHALLSVEIQGETYILDSNTDAVKAEAETGGFQLLYSIGANGAWIPRSSARTRLPGSSHKRSNRPVTFDTKFGIAAPVQIIDQPCRGQQSFHQQSSVILCRCAGRANIGNRWFRRTDFGLA